MPKERKRVELTLTISKGAFEPVSFDIIEDNDLVSVLGQFMIVLIRAQKTLNEIDKKEKEDDIPF